MRVTMCSLVIVLGIGVANAQPGQPPYAAPPPPYQYQPQPQVVLTEEERHLLEMGEISDGKHIGGGIAAFAFGYGVGQAVQGRWQDTGWIFTLGEGASTVAFIYGFVDLLSSCPIDGPCRNNDSGAALFLGGLIGYGVFHVWEVVDAFVVPPRHNRRVRELRTRLGYPQPGVYYGVTPYLAPRITGDGTIGGVTLHF